MKQPVAYLGPPGTYSHLVARKRFGRGAELVPQPTVPDVCLFVSRHRESAGVVPIENSSGGTINETVDILLTGSPRIGIACELSLEVRLALLGHAGEPIRNLYSHFAPLEHCAGWVRRHLPRVTLHAESSTAAAAQRAAVDPGGAALGSRQLARLYGLDILTFPVEVAEPNITSFFSITPHRRGSPPDSARARGPRKTTLAVYLPNVPGALYRLLGAFAGERVNLSRLISRPIRGAHRQYAFLVDLEGAADSEPVAGAIRAARRVSSALRICGSYPVNSRYRS